MSWLNYIVFASDWDIAKQHLSHLTHMQALISECLIKSYFLISQPKHMLWVLKRTTFMRLLFQAPKTNEPRSDKRDLLAIKVKSEMFTEKERPSCCEHLQKI